MGSSVLGVLFVASVAFLSWVDVGSSQDSYLLNKFISWDDMKITQHQTGLSSRDDQNQSRVLVVDKNGLGDSVTVQGAIDMVPDNNAVRVKIYIHPGTYSEKVIVPSSKPYISFIGNETLMPETVITWNSKASDNDENGVPLGTYRSASVTIEADYFCATSITFQNTVVAEPRELGMQAVALRVKGDKAMFYRVKVLGTQDTLLSENGSHYFYQCHIQGSVDFIFGRSRALFEGCRIESTATRYGAIAAHHRDSPLEETGFSFLNCLVTGTGKVYLGRAWGNYSRVIYSYCDIGDVIIPSGWSDWNQPFRQMTVTFGEYQCQGVGANTANRVPWLNPMSYEEVRQFLDKKFIGGEQWLRL